MNSLSGEIRLLKWGIIPKLPYWQVQVGQKFVVSGIPVIITEIAKEFIPDANDEYHVICSPTDDRGEVKKDGGSFIWKTYNLVPDEIQYFAPDEKHNYIKI